MNMNTLKSTAKRDLMRVRLAHLAAKLIAEDGMTDFASAKRKAARQLGATDTQHLPGNKEIEQALQSYRALYQHETHPVILSMLRSEALRFLQLFTVFNPYLTGSVLSGTAGEHSDINLTLFSDDAKAVLLFLLKNKLDFEDGEWKTRLAGRDESVPGYTIRADSGIQVHLIVLPENARHSGSRHPDTHADITTLKQIITDAGDGTQDTGDELQATVRDSA
jgi:hypothetical protein